MNFMKNLIICLMCISSNVWAAKYECFERNPEMEDHYLTVTITEIADMTNHVSENVKQQYEKISKIDLLISQNRIDENGIVISDTLHHLESLSYQVDVVYKITALKKHGIKMMMFFDEMENDPWIEIVDKKTNTTKNYALYCEEVKNH